MSGKIGAYMKSTLFSVGVFAVSCLSAQGSDDPGHAAESEVELADTYEPVMDLNELKRFCDGETKRYKKIQQSLVSECDDIKAYLQELTDSGAESYKCKLIEKEVKTCDQIFQKLEKDMAAQRKVCNGLLIDAFKQMTSGF